MMWDIRGQSAPPIPRAMPSPSFPVEQPFGVATTFISYPRMPVGVMYSFPVPSSSSTTLPKTPEYNSHPRAANSNSNTRNVLRRPQHAHVRHTGHGHIQNHVHDNSHPRVAPHAHEPRLQRAPHGPTFQYSKCNGRKKALCIGINYYGQRNELRGCANDARNVLNFLINHHGFRASDIVLLTDDSRDPRQLPTRKNIINAMYWLVDKARPNDSLFFHFSGHGGQTRDLDGDEIDGHDEVIFPLDYKKRGHIIDDEMHEIMVTPLPTGCRLTALFDSCHSGTVLDLPYIYSSDGRLKGSYVSSRARALKATAADVISWSGCKDHQTAADTTNGSEAVGAMSDAFISCLNRNPNQTYQQLLQSVRRILRKNYSQKPQLGSSHHIDTNLRFVL